MQINNFDKINPYFLGLWLGDGNKDDVGITTIDQEIVDFLQQYAKELKLEIRVKSKEKSEVKVYYLKNNVCYTTAVKGTSLDKKDVCYFKSLKEAGEALNIKYPNNIIHSINGKYSHCGGYTWESLGRVFYNPILYNLQKLNLIRNKHIPLTIIEKESYDYKMNILAGFIDSDGTRSSQNRISISQKNENLIDDLILLCESLGISCFKRKKLITFNNAPYKYYRITMWGTNLNKCPVKLKRKNVNIKLNKWKEIIIKSC